MLGIFFAISSSVLIISNLAAGKLWDLCGIAADGGLIIFPITYIIGDLIVALYGEKKANEVALTSTIMTGFMALIMWIVVKFLPPFPEWNDQLAFEAVFGQVGRVTIASLIAYLVSNLLNNKIFGKIRSNFIGRALGSSVISRLIDSAIFETIAFLGVISLKEFQMQFLLAYCLGLTLETLLAPFSKMIYKRLRHSKLYLSDFETTNLLPPEY